MIKSRTAQLIFQSFFLGIAMLGVVASLGLFDMAFRWDFYIYFTNLSNYLCIGIMVVQLIRTIKRQNDDFVMVHPVLKLASLVAILVTFLIFNFLIAREEGRDPARNYSAMSIIFHIVLPVLYLADWALFHEKRHMKWSAPFSALFFPAAYIIYVFIHAAVRGFDATLTGFIGSNPLIYPYFFLNPEKIGVMGVVRWCVLLAIAFAVLGCLFVAIGRLISRKFDQVFSFADHTT